MHLTGIYGLYFEEDIDLFYVLGLMNSEAISFYYDSYYGQIHLSGGYWNVNGSYLKSLPIVTSSAETQKEISELTRQIIRLNEGNNEIQCSIDSMDLIKHLNEKVYQLYGINHEEQAFIEHHMKGIYGKSEDNA